MEQHSRKHDSGAREPWLARLNEIRQVLEPSVPFRLFARDEGMFVDWAQLSDIRFTDPFFEQTIARCLRRTTNIPSRYETPIEKLREVVEQRPGLKPTGFIFHMSRCGSTLVSQMLATLSRCVTISEAPPIEEVLKLNVPEEQRVEWLRLMISALGRPHHGEDLFFVKFDSWHILDLPLITRAFPKMPWMFLYRDPVEVLVSQRRERGVHVVPSVIGPARLGLPQDEPWFTRLDEYAARVLGRICETAFHHCAHGRCRLVNFTELPQAVPQMLRRFFDVQLSVEEAEKLLGVAHFDAKRPGLNFQSDSAAKQRAASDEVKRLAAQFIQPAYEKLDQARRAQSSLG